MLRHPLITGCAMTERQNIVVSTTDALHAIVADAVETALRRIEPGVQQEQPSGPGELMTFADVRLALRCSAPTLRNLIRDGKIHATRVGDRWRFRPEDVQSFLTKRGENG